SDADDDDDIVAGTVGEAEAAVIVVPGTRAVPATNAGFGISSSVRNESSPGIDDISSASAIPPSPDVLLDPSPPADPALVLPFALSSTSPFRIASISF